MTCEYCKKLIAVAEAQTCIVCKKWGFGECCITPEDHDCPELEEIRDQEFDDVWFQ